MSSRTGNSIILLGTAVLILGLCCLAAAVGDRHDNNLLGLGGSVFGLGVLMVAGGIYLKARVVQRQISSLPAPAVSQSRSRGSCDLCGSGAPVIHCKVHQFHLCADCVAEHYDFRSCVYVPSTRRISVKSSKSMAAHGG